MRRGYPVATHSADWRGSERIWIGSGSTLQGLRAISGHLEAVARAVPGAGFKVICDAGLEGSPIAMPPCPWSAEIEGGDLASADIGITWMPDDLWSRRECGLKVLPYMAAGLPVVANPVGVQRELVVQGRTGFLAESAQDRAEAVRRLARESGLRRAMGAVGRQMVLDGNTPARWAPEFLPAVSGDPLGGARVVSRAPGWGPSSACIRAARQATGLTGQRPSPPARPFRPMERTASGWAD